jgi:mRNA-degrading endonuclease RelE of RelBE toxin-antitoxin system
MAMVIVSLGAQAEFANLPLPIQYRMRGVFNRLEKWPAVSGAKPLRGNLSGNFRIRTGDYRVIFRVEGDTVTVWKIGYRGGIYE